MKKIKEYLGVDTFCETNVGVKGKNILHGIDYEDCNLFYCTDRGRKYFCGRAGFADWDFDNRGAAGNCRGYYICI